MVQWLGIYLPCNAKDRGSVPGQGAEIPCAVGLLRARSLQQENADVPQRGPSAAKRKEKQEMQRGVRWAAGESLDF